jgi:RimJ/RimL family protein N-acetyltransferase
MPHIVGDNIYLRAYRMEDVDTVHEWRTKNEIVWWTGAYVWPTSEEENRKFVEEQAQNVDPANRKFAICRKSDDRYLGHIGYEHLNLREQNSELGIVIGDSDSLSKGIGTEAIGLFLDICFDELGLHRVGLRVIEDNKRGRRCYEKCGFKQEGVIRQSHFSRGRWIDIILMSILEEEYRALRADNLADASDA